MTTKKMNLVGMKLSFIFTSRLQPQIRIHLVKNTAKKSRKKRVYRSSNMILDTLNSLPNMTTTVLDRYQKRNSRPFFKTMDWDGVEKWTKNLTNGILVEMDIYPLLVSLIWHCQSSLIEPQFLFRIHYQTCRSKLLKNIPEQAQGTQMWSRRADLFKHRWRCVWKSRSPDASGSTSTANDYGNE